MAPAALVGPIRSVLSDVAPASVVRFTTLDDVLADSLARPRFYMLLVGLLAFAAVALALASVGLFATYLPARETSNVAPMEALRHE